MQEYRSNIPSEIAVTQISQQEALFRLLLSKHVGYTELNEEKIYGRTRCRNHSYRILVIPLVVLRNKNSALF